MKSFNCSAEEWQQRVELAACYRLLAHFGVDDLTYNHLSVRVAHDADTLLIKAPDQMFGEVCASSLRKHRFDGVACDSGAPLTGGSLVIHAGILAARRDINAVFHTHTVATMGVSSQPRGLLMVNQHAIRFFDRLSYHDFGGFEFNLDQREPLIASLATNRVALLRNHGMLACGRTLAEAFIEHHFLEMACKGQIAAQAGGEVGLIDLEVVRFAATQLDCENVVAGDKDWSACMRLAYRLDPGFAE